MKESIHPNYQATTFTCTCGNVVATRSVEGGDVKVEVCSMCHPFYTGSARVMDTAGRVERFNKRYGKK